MTIKHWIVWPLLIIGLIACGSTGTVTPAPPATGTPDPVMLTATPFIQTAVATHKFIPKPNDLIFVEFFAVT